MRRLASSIRCTMLTAMSTPFAELVAASLKAERFTLVDIGCSGGIEPAWRVFGDRFRAIGFDASVDECRSLAAAETHPGVSYIPGFVDLPPDHPFARRSEGKPHVTRNPFRRLSAAWALELRREKLETASLGEKRNHNVWRLTELADPARRLFAPQVLKEAGCTDVDLLKIDIDGLDFRALNAFDGLLDEFRILALRLEVNLFGGPEDTVHCFHNTDRFMRERGFDLFALDGRNYSSRALPAKFAITAPAQTQSGRILQADAFYARDICSDYQREPGASFGAEKIAKLAAIFSIWRQPDAAAEILLTFRDRLQPLVDIDRALDLLAAQSQPALARPLPYADYMALFASDSPRFYPTPVEIAYAPPSLLKRLKMARRAFNDPNNAFLSNEFK